MPDCYIEHLISTEKETSHEHTGDFVDRGFTRKFYKTKNGGKNHVKSIIRYQFQNTL